MVVKRRLVFVVALSATVLISAAAPALGAFGAAKPNPLASTGFVRVQDIAATGKTANNGPVVAVGWRTSRQPGQFFMSYSLNGGKSYLNSKGKLRKFRVAGETTRGLSLATCRDRVWVGTAARFPGDKKVDSDVLVTRHRVGTSGNAGQAFMTAPGARRQVRDVQVACAGTNLVAIAWLEKSGNRATAKLMIRSQGGLAPSATKRVLGLGLARMDGGISLAATANAVHVAWTKGSARNMRYKRILLGGGPDPTITKKPTVGLANGDVRWPKMAARAAKVVLAYTDDGKVRYRLSKDTGKNFATARRLVGAGSVADPSRAHSAAVSGERIVIEANRRKDRKSTTERWQSLNLGSSWSKTPFGNNGPRVGALHKLNSTDSLLKEAWSNDGPTKDTLRAQYEKP